MSGRYVSLQEAAEMLSVSAKTVRRFIARGGLPAYTLGKSRAGSGRPIRIREDDLVALLHRIPTTGDDRPHMHDADD
jgi:excisionase family DNA binding protein